MRHYTMANYVHPTAIQCRPLNGRHNHRRTGDYRNPRLTGHSAVRSNGVARERLHAEHDRARGQHHQQAGDHGHERIVVADRVLRGVDVAMVSSSFFGFLKDMRPLGKQATAHRSAPFSIGGTARPSTV